jgi:putative FmdB family regulatory protein
MPIYDYICQRCGQRVELVHGIHASGPERCEHCGQGPMRKVLAPPAIHFKGSGWAKKERAASRPKAPSSGDAGAGEATTPTPAASDPPGAGKATAGSAGASSGVAKAGSDEA